MNKKVQNLEHEESFFWKLQELKLVNGSNLFLKLKKPLSLEKTKIPETRNTCMLLSLPFFLLPIMVINFYFDSINNEINAYFSIKDGELPPIDNFEIYLNSKIKVSFRNFFLILINLTNNQTVLLIDSFSFFFTYRFLNKDKGAKILFLGKKHEEEDFKIQTQNILKKFKKKIFFLDKINKINKFIDFKDEIVLLDCLNLSKSFYSKFKIKVIYFLEQPTFICKNHACGGCGIIYKNIYYQTCLAPFIKYQPDKHDETKK